MPHQRPKKQADVEGRTVVARNVHWRLPEYLRHSLNSPVPKDRLVALDGLDHLYRIGNDLVRAQVRTELTRLADDDSRAVSAAAAARLRLIEAPPRPEPEPCPTGPGYRNSDADPPPVQPVATPPAIHPVAAPRAVQPVATPPAIHPVAAPAAIQPVATPPAVEPVAEPPAKASLRTEPTSRPPPAARPPSASPAEHLPTSSAPPDARPPAPPPVGPTPMAKARAKLAARIRALPTWAIVVLIFVVLIFTFPTAIMGIVRQQLSPEALSASETRTSSDLRSIFFTGNAVRATINVGTAPRSLAITPNGRYLCTADSGGNTVSVVDLTTNTVAEVRGGELGSFGPGSVAAASDSRHVYAGSYDRFANSSKVVVIDVTSRAVTASLPLPVVGGPIGVNGLAVTPDGRFAYAVVPNGSMVSVVDLAAR